MTNKVGKNLNILRTKRVFHMKYKTFFINFKGLPLKLQGQKFKQLSINSSDKSKLLREIYFLLESLFQVIAFFLLSEGGFLVRIS